MPKHVKTQCWVTRLSDSEFQADGPATAKYRHITCGTTNFR